MLYDVVVIGAGASGLMAAITAAKADAKVLVVEGLSEYGKKITMTGNGKCNLTNDAAGDISHYHTDNEELLKGILSEVTPEALLEEFNSLGLLCREKNGYWYPYHENAGLVRDLLGQRLYDYGGQIETGRFLTGITSLLPSRDPEYDAGYRFAVGGYITRKCIIATGSLAGRVFPGDDNEFYRLLNHPSSIPFIPYVPSLCKCYVSDEEKKRISYLKGLRVKGKVTLLTDNEEVKDDYGEIQFTEDALSGIVVFNLSGYASEAIGEGKACSLKLDLLPEYSLEEMKSILEKRYAEGLRYAKALLGGIFSDKLLNLLCKENGIDPSVKKNDLDIDSALNVIRLAKAYKFDIAGTAGFKDAQVARGGVPLSDMTPELMHKRFHEIYICGEVLNVDGECGGFNLHFAFASGIIAGRSAAKKAL